MNTNLIIHFSFPGGAGLFPLLIGKGYAMKKYLKEKLPHVTFLYSGISSGSFVALLLALNLNEKEIHTLMYTYLIQYIEKKWYIIEQFHMWFFLKRILRHVLGIDGYKLLNGKFRVGISKLSTKLKLEKQIIDKFQNSEDVINSILTSCHLAVLGRQPFKYFHKSLAVDGGVTYDHIQTEDLPKEIQKKTITFRIGYEHFPPQLLSFSQAMPLLTAAKWERMYKEGKLCFKKKIQFQLDEFFSSFFLSPQIIPSLKKKNWKSTITVFQPNFCSSPSSENKKRIIFHSQQNQKKKQDFWNGNVNVNPRNSGGPDQIIRGIATGWIEVIAGYLIWSLLFTWNFILNRPF